MVSPAFEQIKKHIESNRNFLLSGGAGSGKTYSLVQTLEHILVANPKTSLACITYTNEAVKEIKSRFEHDTLRVSTIHDFLWDVIKTYQKNLKETLLELIKNEIISLNSSAEFGKDELEIKFFNDKKIQYKEYRRIEEGIVSHDDILKISHRVFEKYPLLRKIVKDKFRFIFIDEYQDTSPLVIEIFLDFIQRDPKNKNVIGLFGDKVQSIYDSGIGDIESFVKEKTVFEVIKDDNYRCSKAVISLLNKIRLDITQNPSGSNSLGDIKFVYSQKDDIKISDIKTSDVFKSWNFKNFQETKELYLTHRLIANENNFGDILNLYRSNIDRLLKEDNQDKLIKHLFKIQEIIHFYDAKNFNEFIKKTEFKLQKLSDKRALKEKIAKLKAIQNDSIENIIQTADELGLVKKDDNLDLFIENKLDLYGEVKKLSFEQIAKVFDYVRDFTPFSTQHNVKGTEYKNVLVVLDNGGWNNYNFKYLFENNGNPNVLKRTHKIFYVCCSRAKDNLVVFFHKPSAVALEKAEEWFGKENMHEI